MYYIRKIECYTKKYGRSEMNFTKGLNIICGPSNTGKSLVLEIIDYMFGGEGKKIIECPVGFTKIGLEVDVDGKTVLVSREVGNNEISVESSADGIEDGVYKIKSKPISKFWLSLMGIHEDVQVIQKLDYSPQTLGVRTFIHTFLIKESRMVSDNSIFKSGIGYNKNIPTSTITSLLYLCTENNFLKGHKKVDSKLIEEKNKAIRGFVDRSLKTLADQRVEALKNEDADEKPEVLENKISEILKELDDNQRRLKETYKENENIANNLFKIDNELAENQILQRRFSALMSQYESDIKRLTFIAEGDLRKGDIPHFDYCPFCNGELSKEQEESCVEAAVQEARKIEIQMRDLKSASESIINEIDSLKEKKRNLQKEQIDIQDRIRGELEPKIADLGKLLSGYRIALGQAKVNEMFDSFEKTLNTELKDSIEEEEKGDTFDIRNVINKYFTEKLDDRLLTILREVNYEKISSASFDVESCDAKVNGASKATQGKGYKAYLNTVMALALQECLESYDKHKIQLMAIDSPILSLVEKRDPNDPGASDVMKKGLFTYFVNNTSQRQTIIVENEIPSIEYGNTNIIEFTKDENNGRYGLIQGYIE